MYKKLSSTKKKLVWFGVVICACLGICAATFSHANATRTPNFGASFDGGIYGPAPAPTPQPAPTPAPAPAPNPTPPTPSPTQSPR